MSRAGCCSRSARTAARLVDPVANPSSTTMPTRPVTVGNDRLPLEIQFFNLSDPIDDARGNVQRTDHLLIDDPNAAARDRAHCQLLASRHAELANENTSSGTRRKDAKPDHSRAFAHVQPALPSGVGPDGSWFVFSWKAQEWQPRQISGGVDPTIAGTWRKAMHYIVKIEISGVAGPLAPLIGKQPDTHIWVLDGEAPAFRLVGGSEWTPTGLRGSS
jgi:hypothetical protein